MKPIVIAGAGPAGCSLALYLAQHDIPVVSLEAEESMQQDMRALKLHPSTLDMLEGLGLMEATDEATQIKRQANFMKCSGDPVLAKAFVMETSMINCVRESCKIN